MPSTLYGEKKGEWLGVFNMNNDHWVKNDMMFICDGQGYCLNKYLQTVCIGPVDDDGNVTKDDVEKAPETYSAAKNDVTKLVQVENQGANDSQAQNDVSFVTSKHPGGRPRKTGDDVCRMTKYRRKKELQLAMAL